MDFSNMDFVVAIDKSGSMATMDCPGGKSRWDYAQETAQGIALKASKFDADGITIAMFNTKTTVYKNTTPDVVEKVFNENDPTSSTNTAGMLDTLFADYIANPAKNQLIIVITDGKPDDEMAVVKSIVDFTKKVPEEKVSVLFLQIGNDAHATQFLQMLDDDLVSKHGAAYDMVDTKTTEQIADMSLIEVFEQAIND